MKKRIKQTVGGAALRDCAADKKSAGKSAEKSAPDLRPASEPVRRDEGILAVTIADHICSDGDHGAELLYFSVTCPRFEGAVSKKINRFYADYAAECVGYADRFADTVKAEYSEIRRGTVFRRYVYEVDFQVISSDENRTEIRVVRRVLRGGRQLGAIETFHRWILRNGILIRNSGKK